MTVNRDSSMQVHKISSKEVSRCSLLCSSRGHTALPSALGIPIAVLEGVSYEFSNRECDTYIVLLCEVIKQYITMEVCYGNSSSDTGIPYGGQPQRSGFRSALPSHLILPATRMLVEMAILLSYCDSLDTQCCGMETLMWLLR